MRTADLLRDELLLHPGVVVTDVPYSLAGNPRETGRLAG
jgi:hypothetical protein